MNKNNERLKNRVFIYIILIGIVMFFLFLLISYFNYQDKMKKQFENKVNQLESIIKTEEERIVQLYQSRLQKNLKSYGVIDAIRTNNKEYLYSLIKPRYDELLKENIHFKAMHFHTKDNKTFLRMHKPDKSGDDLSGFRQIVVDTNKERKEFFGFEEGKYGYFYRIIVPIIHQQEHLGSVEFGLGLEYFIENLRRLIPDTNFGLLIEKTKAKNSNFKSINNYGIIADYNNFFTPVADKIALDKEFQILLINDNTYLVSSNIYIKDYKGNNAIKILFAIDITSFKQSILEELIYLLLLGCITYIISIFIINGAFQKYIASIKEQSKQLDENVIVSSTDLKGVITYASDAFCKISGYTKGELVGKSHSIIRHPDMKKEIFKELWETIQEGKEWRGEVKNKKKDGSSYWVKAFISPNYDQNKNIIGYTAIRTDISDKKVIEKLSQTDKLTQIYNRLKLDEVLDIEIERANRYKTPLSIISLDIDHFKSVNDTYGHQAGDIVLVQISSILSSHVRKTDTLGRWGGEEFLIICSQTDSKGAKLLAESLRKSIEDFQFDTVNRKTSSFGVTQYSMGEELSEFLKRCDQALYKSKNDGRNRVSVL